MDYKEKLQHIQNITELTQQELADRLSVTFVTLNSWINGRSTPRKKAQEKINDLYESYVVKEKIPLSRLEEKKSLLNKMKISEKNIFSKIISRPDIYKSFVLLLTYNTNRIEGSTFTEHETAAVLFDNSTIPDKNLIEHLEVKNHQISLEFIFSLLSRNKKLSITEDLLLNLHAKLMNGILNNAGAYRNHNVRIVGAHIPTASHIKIPNLMQQIITNMNESSTDVISQLAKTHADFEQIHPFSDGNGRIGRLLMNIIALRNNYPPVLIEDSKKHLYYAYLAKAQLEQDYNFLEDLICDSLFESFHILN